MTPAAQLQSLVDLLATYDKEKKPLDAVVSSFMKERHYIGAKDRRLIVDLLYALLRRWAYIHWKLDLAGHPPTVMGGTAAARLRLISYLYLCEGKTLHELAVLFNGQPYHPMPLETLEKRVLQSFQRTPSEAQAPQWVKQECPQWLWSKFQDAYPDQSEDLLRVLNTEASFDIRTNKLKTKRLALQERLDQEQGLAFKPTSLSPLGLRLAERQAVGSWSSFEEGFFDIQDEASQLAALLVDARPGQFVLDFCAGAGGKTLAIAAQMNNKGRVLATDAYAWRLNRAAERLRRAGIHNVECKPLDEGEGLPKWLKRQRGQFDRVLVDAPCSGTGTWRRNPDLKWRTTPQQLDQVRLVQHDLLMKAAPLVKSGGRLIYITCSLLPEENQRQIEAFLMVQPDFDVLPMATVWADVIEAPCPTSEETLTLTPYHHGTDGFYVAILKRK